MEKTVWMDLTPADARLFLKKNTRNPRDFSSSWAKHLLGVLERGEYVPTHQGIGFYEDGAVCDGQHRLWAISQMPDGFSIRIPVTTGLKDTAGDGVDVGKKRTNADILQIDRRFVEVATLFAKLYHSDKKSAPTAAEVRPFLALIEEPHAELIAFKPGQVKLWTSTPFRAAAVFNMLRGRDREYIKVTFAALAEYKAAEMSPAAHALFKSYLAGSVRASAWLETFAKGVKVFDPELAELRQIKNNDQSRVIQNARILIGKWAGVQKKAPVEAEANSVKALPHSKGLRAA
jgi:hypothetical protein